MRMAHKKKGVYGLSPFNLYSASTNRPALYDYCRGVKSNMAKKICKDKKGKKKIEYEFEIDWNM